MHRERRLVARQLLLAITLLCAGVILVSAETAAQETPGEWAEPVILFETMDYDEEVFNPVLLADSAGDVHAFWAYNPPGSPFLRGQYIAYAQFSDGAWTAPGEIVTGPDGYGARRPAAALDARGYVHLVFQHELTTGGLRRIYYTRAHITEAGSARGWREPELLHEEERGISYDILADSSGVLHVVYSDGTAGASSVQYVRSADWGDTWSAPGEIPVAGESETFIATGALAEDPGGAFHFVWWTQIDLESDTSSMILYSRSLDQGENWMEPVELSARGRVAVPEIATVGQYEIHVTWMGNFPDNGRFHRWSPDRGQTWSETANLQEVSGWTGSMPMAVDNEGGVHMVNCAGGGIEELMYAHWQGGTLSEPEHVQDVIYCHGPQIAVSAGNRLNVIWWQKDKTRIMFTSRELPFPPQPAEPVPTALMASDPTLTPPPGELEPTLPPTAAWDDASGGARSLGSASASANATVPLVLGALAPALVVAGVLAWNVIRRGRRSG